VELGRPSSTPDEWRQRLGADDRTFVAGMVANLTSNKDHATLIRAWRIVVDRLRADGRRSILALAGQFGDTHDALRGLASALDLDAKVRFLGQVGDVAGLLHAADLGVFSSPSEGCPNGVLECMAAGLAVVGSDIDGIREAIGKSGARYLAQPGDHEQFAALILALAADPARRAEMGRANRRRVDEAFSPREMGDRMAALCAGYLERTR
jgi:glycosyltransferase involved in cell wall biosynthesis